MAVSRPVVFLDKDGTLIEDLPYNVDPRRIRFAPGARQAMRLLGAAGHPLVVASNQSGVARGYFSEADLEAVGAHLRAEIEALGARLEAFLWCPHLPDASGPYAIECDCRKPLPGLIERAARELGLSLVGGWFIGDTWMDVVAGRAAGLQTILVGPEHLLAAGWPVERQPDHAVRDLFDAARIVVRERVGAGLAGAGAGR
jgi:D-glycero-D-manno-heptose 1,7-bisphosphate phosphatase